MDINDNADAPRQVSVAELLARNGRSATAGGRGHRRADDDEAPGGSAPATQPAVAEPPVAEVAAVAPAAPVDPEPEAATASHPLGTAVLLVELVAAAAIGAALWLGFRWLWSELPVVALVLALVVTVAMVVGLRLVRRVDDVTSLLLAIVVGLVVTMSPAALTLVGGG